jgi:hypothetical protein
MLAESLRPRQSCFAQRARNRTAAIRNVLRIQHDWTAAHARPRGHDEFRYSASLANDHGWGMKNKTALFASVFFCVVGTQQATANEPGFYVGGYVGQSSKDVSRAEYEELSAAIQSIFLFEPTQQQQSFDETDIGFAVIAGYGFTQYFAIEGGYARLGEVSFKTRASGDFPLEPGTQNITIESETTGFIAALVGMWPLTRDWELVGRVGVLVADNNLKFSIRSAGSQFIPPGGSRITDSFSKSSTDTFASVGVSRRLFEIYDLRLEYQRVLDSGFDLTGGKADLDSIMLGLLVTF